LIRRRSMLALPALPAILAACGEPPAFDGGWLGADPVRGHQLQEAAPPAPSDTRRCSVAIVGGGVAGLAAARALLAAGIDDIRLFELEDQAGGNARGHSIAGLACPQGAHYLPLPGPQAHELAEWLHQIGLLRQEAGRTVADERHLCHSPQERLWLNGPWAEGVLPPVAGDARRAAQYGRFAQRVDQARRTLGFSLPTRRSPWTAGHAALDAQTFAAWLDAEGLDDPGLRWYLDYACRDDYGAGAGQVSAWAGLHYFASRDGFAAPGAAEARPDPVFTWPEGNAWLVRRLGAPLGDRLQTGVVVRRIAEGRHEVAVDAGGTRWLAQRVIVAVPLHVARRIVESPPAALQAAQVPQAPWLVANLALSAPLTPGLGAAPAWDNVLYDPTGRAPGALGYVDALHQLLHRPPGRALITAYWALPVTARPALLAEGWRTWAGRIVADLARAHPDLPRKLLRADLSRYGHAMAIPAPGVRGQPALQALAAGPSALSGRLHFAHGDLAAYSVFEEAFTAGDAAGRAAAAAVAARARPAPRPAA
jgi:monoamine oxidase